MTFEFLEPSNAAKAALRAHAEGPKLWALIKDKFEACPCQRSFAVDLPEGLTGNYLRSIISKRGKAAGKRFTVIDHGKNLFEICRIDDGILSKQMAEAAEVATDE